MPLRFISLYRELTPQTVAPHPSTDKIPSSVDAVLDRQLPSNGTVMPGISISHGEVKVEDASPKDINGAAKRKVRESLTRPDYADAESSDDDLPLVCSRASSVLYPIRDQID